jgi:hypothetical protein
MKKVIRLNENDIEKLVKKIIKEEKSINEAPVDWVRSKFNQDEELALLIYKGIKSGNVRSLQSNDNNLFTFTLDGHRISIHQSVHQSPEKRGKINLPQLTIMSENYIFKLDNEYLHVSESLKEKIWKLLKDLKYGSKERFKNAKNLFSKYNLSDKERNKIEDTDSIFDQL